MFKNNHPTLMVDGAKHPGLVDITLGAKDLRPFEELINDLQQAQHGLSETAWLDETANLCTDAISDFLPKVVAKSLGELVIGRETKVVALRLPEFTVEGVPPTPTRYWTPEDGNLLSSDAWHRLIMSAVSAQLYPYGYTTRQPGVVQNNVIALQQSTGMPLSAAGNALSLHTEDVFYNRGPGRNVSPDLISFQFIRNPHSVPTTVAIPDFNELDDETLNVLREAWFDPTGPRDPQHSLPRVSVLYNEPGSPDTWIRYMVGLNRDKVEERSQIDALRKLEQHLAERQIQLCMGPGDILIQNTRVALHGRPALTPQFDGMGRWHRRINWSIGAERIIPYEERPHIVDPPSIFKNAN